jgi:hypothetical protein
VVHSCARLEYPGADIQSDKEDTPPSSIPIVVDISSKTRVRTEKGTPDAFGLADKWHTFQIEYLLMKTKKKKESQKTNLQT